jgi:predicted secreted hydrolase
MLEKRSDSIYIPTDTGPHMFSNIEWWYFFAYLKGNMGGHYALMASFFQVGDLVCTKGHYLIFTLIDLNKNTKQNYSALDPKLKWNMILMYLPLYLAQHPLDKSMWKLYSSFLIGRIPVPHQKVGKAEISRNPVKLTFGENSLVFCDEIEGSFTTKLIKKDTEIKMQFTPLKPIALIGEDGKPDDLFYYSFTKNVVQGHIQNNQGAEDVTGRGWFDHQWGRNYSLLTGIGWNWFGLQLSDGRELLLNERFSLNKKREVLPMANLITEDGTLRFTRKVFFKEKKYWQSPDTKAIFPVIWEITIPDFSMELEVKALFPEQEMPVIGPLKSIWEGTCLVTGQKTLSNKKKISIDGKGFMELVGYNYSSAN